MSSTDAHETPLLNARAVVERERLRVYQQQATIDVADRFGSSSGPSRRCNGWTTISGRPAPTSCAPTWHGWTATSTAAMRRPSACWVRAPGGERIRGFVGGRIDGLGARSRIRPLALARCIELEAEFADDLVARLEVAGLRAVLIGWPAVSTRPAGRWPIPGGDPSLGLTQASAYMALFDCQLETLAGQPEAAERAVRDAATITEETHDRWFQSTVRVDCPRAAGGRRRVGRRRAAVEAIDDVPAPQDPEWAIKRHSARALLAAGSGEFSIAIAEAAAATGIADATTMLVFRAHAYRARAEVFGSPATGRPPPRQRPTRCGCTSSKETPRLRPRCGSFWGLATPEPGCPNSICSKGFGVFEPTTVGDPLRKDPLEGSHMLPPRKRTDVAADRGNDAHPAVLPGSRDRCRDAYRVKDALQASADAAAAAGAGTLTMTYPANTANAIGAAKLRRRPRAARTRSRASRRRTWPRRSPPVACSPPPRAVHHREHGHGLGDRECPHLLLEPARVQHAHDDG